MSLGLYPRLMSKIFRRRFYQHDIVCNGAIEPYKYMYYGGPDNEIMKRNCIYKGVEVYMDNSCLSSVGFTDGYSFISFRSFFRVGFSELKKTLIWEDRERFIKRISFYKVSRSKSAIIVNDFFGKNFYHLFWLFKDSDLISLNVISWNGSYNSVYYKEDLLKLRR